MVSYWCQQDTLVERVFLHFLAQMMKRPLTALDRKEYYLAHLKQQNEPIPLTNTVGECNFKPNEVLKCKNRYE